MITNMSSALRPTKMLDKCLKPGVTYGRKLIYPNLPLRKQKRKASDVKEAIRDERRLKNVNRFDTDFTSEKFYTPTRTRLFFRMLQDMRNNNKVTRKPMPEKVKKEFAKKAKEYNEYKVFELQHIHKEQESFLKVRAECAKAAMFLPTYLYNEVAFDQPAGDRYDEFNPYVLYIDQMLEILPREMTERVKLMPALKDEYARQKIEREIRKGQK